MNLGKRITMTALLSLAALTLSACAGGDPLAPDGDRVSETLIVGSQDYYSNVIIAEIYSQALEQAGFTVDRQFRIGQREVYLPEIEKGNIDLFPEYTGPLLQYWAKNPPERLADDVYQALVKVTPENLRVLKQSPATDQDSYVVSRAFAEKWGLKNIEDLAKVTVPMVMGANSEGENRPNGPKGLQASYGVSVGFTPIEDGGGPLTIKALNDGDIQLAIMYTADPAMQKNDLVSLKDTKGLFLASHVVPLASNKVNEKAAQIINTISTTMTEEMLLALNNRSVDEQLPAATIAKDWLREQKLN